MLERMHPSVPICLCMVYLLGLRLTVVFSKRFGYTTFREKPPLVAKIAVFAVLPRLPLFTPGVNGDHPLCAVVSKTTFRAIKGSNFDTKFEPSDHQQSLAGRKKL